MESAINQHNKLILRILARSYERTGNC